MQSLFARLPERGEFVKGKFFRGPQKHFGQSWERLKQIIWTTGKKKKKEKKAVVSYLIFKPMKLVQEKM